MYYGEVLRLRTPLSPPYSRDGEKRNRNKIIPFLPLEVSGLARAHSLVCLLGGEITGLYVLREL